MSQSYLSPFVGTDFANAVLKSDLPDTLEALRSKFSGASEPSAKVAYQSWMDTTLDQLKIRDSANAAWHQVLRMSVALEKGAMAAQTERLWVARVPVRVLAIGILSDTATTGSTSGTKEWTFMLENFTQTLNLFSATPSTATNQAGIGGGEIPADAAYWLTPDQNDTLAADDVLRLVVGQNGTPTALPDIRLQIELAQLLD